MIYLIGGAPRMGKSVLARRLMKELGIPWLSTDTLRSVFVKLTPKDQQQKLFPFVGFEGDIDNETLFQIPFEKLVDQQWTESRSVSGGLISFIYHQIGTREPYILEGVHLLPDLVKRLKNERPNDIREIYLVDTNEQRVLSGLKKNQQPGDWLIGASDATYQAVAKFVVACSERIQKEAKAEGLKVFQRQSDFEGTINQAMAELIRDY